MSLILQKEKLSENVYRLIVKAPEIAAKRKPGQFVIIRLNELGERIPLSIANSNAKSGTIELIIQAVGKTTHQLVNLKIGDKILDIVGPLGVPAHVEKLGLVVMIAGGIGAAPLYPIAKAFKEAGNQVIAIIGARTKELIILEKEFTEISERVIITTDDGSYGQKGVVTTTLKHLIESKKDIKKVIAIGPLIMMKFVSELTKQYKIPTMVSLNSMMIDGTGMCGGCRVTVGGKTRFTCVHGPEFDGHQVDFDLLLNRSKIYEHTEQCRLDAYFQENK